MYSCRWLENAMHELSKLPDDIADLIEAKVSNYLVQEPRGNSHPLKGEFKGLWTHGIARYRVIYSIDEVSKVITIHKVGSRKSVYD